MSQGITIKGKTDDDQNIPVRVDNSGHLLSTGRLVNEYFDSISYTLVNPTTDQYTYKDGATTVATVTIEYTDDTKSQILDVTKV